VDVGAGVESAAVGPVVSPAGAGALSVVVVAAVPAVSAPVAGGTE
jgi:hypothetical protein